MLVYDSAVSYDAAHAYLLGDIEGNLALLGALEYDPVCALHGVVDGERLAALALVLEPDGPPGHLRAPVMLAANDEQTLHALLDAGTWPNSATFVVQRRALFAPLEAQFRATHAPESGLLHFVADHTPHYEHALVRQLTLEDADALELAACSLSPIALRNWLKRGWRAFGAVQYNVLLAHALAAYPVAGTEEVSAVFTAPRCRHQGLASAVVAATIADIVTRGQRAVYVCRRTNLASQRVALGLGLRLASETWEITVSTTY